MPPARVATIGRAHAIASSSDVPSPSVTELIDEQVEPLDAAEDVGAEAGQQHVLLEMVVVHLPLELLAQLAFAEDDEARVGHLLDDEVRRLDQIPLALVRHQRRDVADDRRADAAARTPRAR